MVIPLHCIVALVLLVGSAFGFVHPSFKLPSVVAFDSAVTIQVNQTSFDESVGWVSVNWANVGSPNVNDTIMVFTPSDIDFTSFSPVKYKNASAVSDGYLTTGGGTTTFKLVNMRADYVIVFVLANGTVVAKTPSITFANYNDPLQGHLATTADPSVLRLMWVTNNTDMPMVMWGTTSNTYPYAEVASSFTYTVDMMCGAPANTFGWRDPGQIHEALITNLKSGQQYYYIFGDKKYGFSSERTFYGPQTDSSATVNILTFGDMGKGELDGSDEHYEQPDSVITTNNLIKEANANKIDAVMHIGDISYAVGYSSQWDEFFTQIEPLASQVPYLVCPGNHEFDYLDNYLYNGTDSGGECGVPYMQRFHMPITNPKANWYSQNLGPVHWVMMNTEQDFYPGSQQYAFIVNDLQAVNRKITPWVVFAGHRPMYIDSNDFSPISGDQTVALELRRSLEATMYQYKVDLALWGHHHSYQRTCAVFNETCTAGAPVHLIIGTGGAWLSTNLLNPTPSWINFTDIKSFGYSKVQITPQQLHFQYITNDGTITDDFTLTKP